MKITKSKLAQIIQEELEATTAVATNEIYLPFFGGKMPIEELDWMEETAQRAIKSALFMADGESGKVKAKANSEIDALKDATKRMEYYVHNRHKKDKLAMATKRWEDALESTRAVGSAIAQASRDEYKLEQAAKMKKQAAADKRWKAGAEERARFAKQEAEAQMRDKEKFAKEWWYKNAGLGSQERASEKWDSVINSRDKDRFINGGGSELEWPMHAAKKSAAERKGRRMRENKITKTQLAQIIQEELSNTVSEAEQWKMGRSMKAADLAADPLYAAENQGIVDAQDDFMRSKRGEGVSPDLPSFGSQEEEDAYGKAWGKEWHRLMDNAVKNRVDMERKDMERRLNRPPEPETDADREAAEAELDFESTYSEGKMKITKSQLATIIKEELGDYPNFSNMESLLSKLLSSIEGLDLSIDYLAGSISGEDAFSAAANQRTFGRYAASQPALKENKMKITKSKLAQIVQEELSAVKAEGYGNYKRDEKNPNPKGLSPQYRFTDAASTDDTEERFHKSKHSPYSDKKPKRGMKKEALNTEEKEGQITYIIKMEEIISPYLHKEITDQVNQVSRDGDWSAGLNSMSDEQVHSIYSDVSEDFWSNHAPKEKYYEGLDESAIAPYTNLKGYALQALRDLGGEDVLGDIAHVAGRAWAEDNWSRGDERLSEEGMFYSVKEALESLEVDGRVRLTQGGPDSTDEEVYALVHKEDLDEARG